MSIYGYHRLTNPKLSKRMDLFVFQNIVSPHTHTNTSLNKVLTFSSHKEPSGNIEKGDIFDILNSAHFYTFWISNQTALEGYDLTTSLYALKANERLFNTEKNGHDESLIPKIRDALSKDQQKVIFVHLMGNHFIYRERYPNEYNIFKNGKNLTVDHYDNSVLYNDHVVNAIFDLNNNSDTIMIYFSDHGEEVYDTANFAGHNETIATASMYEIPLIIKSSGGEKFKIKYDTLYSTENLIHSIQGLTGIISEYYIKDNDIFLK